MHQFWDERYREEGVYGKKPNPFWVDQLSRLSPTPEHNRVLLPCEGEGRNAVWAAAQGWDVDAFDGSSVAVATCQRWATEAGVEVHVAQSDAFAFEGRSGGYDVVGLFYAHMPAGMRLEFHQRAIDWLRPGGTLILEGFEPRQLGLASGGPKDPAMLFTPEMLGADFGTLTILKNKPSAVNLDEGPYHQGPAHIIQFTAQKPA